MAKNYDINVWSQPSLYQPEDRQLQIFFSEPEDGANANTGIFLLIAGYGGHAQSNVFKKMREQFADTYNLVTVQCNYFGWEFMQAKKPTSVSVDKMQVIIDGVAAPMTKASTDSGEIEYLFNVPMEESLENFNDMGIVQAMDNLIACKVVVDVLTDNGIVYNKNRVFAYGFSHGAYLAHLCNVFMPRLFSAVIDNSSYLIPSYMFVDRAVYDAKITEEQSIGVLKGIYDYLISYIVFDKEIYMLEILYKNMKNYAKLIGFHGIDDFMTDVKTKFMFYQGIDNAICEIIDESKVDRNVFFSTKHGLNADFLKLFEYVVGHYTIEQMAGEFTDRIIETNACIYKISNETGIPIMGYVVKGHNE